KTRNYPGMLFFIYLIFNGMERFFIEKVRINDVYSFMGTGFTQAQFIAIMLFLIGVAGSFWIWRKHQKS
ncbi:MAG: prolipoprotein diacylglyceryl transferase, partial [Mameliella sp.]|nr:prolipoprotein diacylglyceryl transferase [Phaeodactylibacter sp.]